MPSPLSKPYLGSTVKRNRVNAWTLKRLSSAQDCCLLLRVQDQAPGVGDFAYLADQAGRTGIKKRVSGFCYFEAFDGPLGPIFPPVGPILDPIGRPKVAQKIGKRMSKKN